MLTGMDITWLLRKKKDTGKMRRICILCQKGQHKAGDYYYYFSMHSW